MGNIIYEYNRDFAQKTYLREVEKNDSDLHFHRNLEVLYLEEGDMIGSINNVNYTYQSHDMIFVPSYNSHVFNSPIHGKTIIFIIPYEYTVDFFPFLNQNTIDYTLDDHEYNKTILPLLKLLLTLAPTANNNYVIKGISITIMGLILSHYKTNPVNKNSNNYLLINALEYIEKNYDKKLTLSILAEKFGYNKDYFSRLFNKNISASLTDYINSIRVEHVTKKLIENGYDDILKLIFECGFDSATTFYRAFKKLYNHSPKAFFSKLNAPKICSTV